MTSDSTESVLSTKQLISGVILALAVGAALTIFVILPAEQGEDPTGFGETTGLTQLSGEDVSEAGQTELDLAPDVLYISIDPVAAEIPFDAYGRSLPVLDGTNYLSHQEIFKTETIEIIIPGDGEVEYKAIMDKGETLLYSWSANGDLYFDFHAHEVDGNPDFWTRYLESEGREDSGSIVAPYTGQHGWYWLNLMEEDITIQLKVAGYYDEIVELDLEGPY